MKPFNAFNEGLLLVYNICHTDNGGLVLLTLYIKGTP